MLQSFRPVYGECLSLHRASMKQPINTRSHQLEMSSFPVLIPWLTRDRCHCTTSDVSLSGKGNYNMGHITWKSLFTYWPLRDGAVILLSTISVFEIACLTSAWDQQKQRRSTKTTVYAGPKDQQSFLFFWTFTFPKYCSKHVSKFQIF